MDSSCSWIPLVCIAGSLLIFNWDEKGTCSRICILGQGDKQHIHVDKLVSFGNFVVDSCR